MRLAALVILFTVLQDTAAFRVVCVYTNWAQYRPDGGKFLPEDVDPSLCTHVIYVYAKLKGNKLASVEWNDDGNSWSDGMYDRVNNLKQLNPDMKTLLGVGGWNMGSKDFSKMAAGRIYRRIFAKSAVKFLRDRNFDGLTIDWQHPTKRGGRPRDRVNFSLLLQEIRKAFDEESKKSGTPALLLTAGVSASQRIIEDAYEVDNITKYTDFINVFAYDLHGSWENFTGHPSQLYARDEEMGPMAEMNVDATMRYWMSHVSDRTKLNLGISTSGRTFTLADPLNNGVYSLAYEPGLAGDFTQQAGMLAYYERCFQYADATRVWDDTSKSAYWYSGDQWIAGEDEESVKAKVHWMRYNTIGGIMLSSLDMDDYSGIFCTGDIYPLLLTIHEQMVAPLPPNPYNGRPRKGKSQEHPRSPSTTVQDFGSSMILPPTAHQTPQTTYITTTKAYVYPTTNMYNYFQETTTAATPLSNAAIDTLHGSVNSWQQDVPVSQQNQHWQPDASQNMGAAYDSHQTSNTDGSFSQNAGIAYDSHQTSNTDGSFSQNAGPAYDPYQTGNIDGSLSQNAGTIYDPHQTANTDGSYSQNAGPVYDPHQTANIEGSFSQNAGTVYDPHQTANIEGSFSQNTGTVYDPHQTANIDGSFSQNAGTVYDHQQAADIDGSFSQNAGTVYDQQHAANIDGSLSQNAGTVYNQQHAANIDGSFSQNAGTVYDQQHAANIDGSFSRNTGDSYDPHQAQNANIQSVGENNNLHLADQITNQIAAQTNDVLGSGIHSQTNTKTTKDQQVVLSGTTGPVQEANAPSHRELIIEPVQETKLRTFLKDAATLPTHQLINGILGILSIKEQVPTQTPEMATIPSLTTTTVNAVVEEKPKSRVHAVLPISILRSFKGPISIFGGSKVVENRPIKQGVTNIWDDPYAQQFLRNSRTFTTYRKAANTMPTSKLPTSAVIGSTNPSIDNAGHFTNGNMSSGV